MANSVSCGMSVNILGFPVPLVFIGCLYFAWFIRNIFITLANPTRRSLTLELNVER